MTGEAWGALGALVTTLGLIAMYLGSKRHVEKVEDSNMLAAQITAIGEAAVDVVSASQNVATFVQSMMGPMKTEVEDNRVAIQQMKEQHAGCSQRIDHLESQFDVIIGYVNSLRRQVRDLGGEPVEPPDPLLGFQFD